MKRIEFDFSNESVSKLDELVERTNSATRAELLRRALSVYEYLKNQTDQGYKINLSKDDEKILIPGELI